MIRLEGRKKDWLLTVLLSVIAEVLDVSCYDAYSAFRLSNASKVRVCRFPSLAKRAKPV